MRQPGYRKEKDVVKLTMNFKQMRIAMALFAIMVLMAALMAGTAAAKQGKGPDLKTLNFKGTVAAIAEDGSSISVDVEKGNKAARSWVGQQASFTVTDGTRVEVEGIEDASLTDVQSGDWVHVQSKAPEDASEFVARKVWVEDEQE
jgi:membrane protein implicated in regulation of membrane protease activity